MMKGSAVERTIFLLLQILNLSCYFVFFFLFRVPYPLKSHKNLLVLVLGWAPELVDKTPPQTNLPQT